MGAIYVNSDQADTVKLASHLKIPGKGTQIMIWDNEIERSIELRELIGMDTNFISLMNPIRKI